MAQHLAPICAARPFCNPRATLLQAAGLWDRLAGFATPLQVMAILDLGTRADTPPRHAFDAADISDEPFGWNLPNWLLRREMMAHLAASPRVDLRLGVATTQVLSRSTEARVRLSDGSGVSAQLVVAADGRGSPTRNGRRDRRPNLALRAKGAGLCRGP